MSFICLLNLELSKRLNTKERRQRRHSNSFDDTEVIKRVEDDYKSDTEIIKNPSNIYNRLAASVYKYQYLHKVCTIIDIVIKIIKKILARR